MAEKGVEEQVLAMERLHTNNKYGILEHILYLNRVSGELLCQTIKNMNNVGLR